MMVQVCSGRKLLLKVLTSENASFTKVGCRKSGRGI